MQFVNEFLLRFYIYAKFFYKGCFQQPIVFNSLFQKMAHLLNNMTGVYLSTLLCIKQLHCKLNNFIISVQNAYFSYF